jgi:hypothetical protein
MVLQQVMPLKMPWIQGASFPRNKAYLWVRRHDEESEATL